MEMEVENILMASQAIKNINESGFVHSIYSKLEFIKTKSDEKEKNNEYESLINKLITENQNILSIANLYKSEYERINISDEDIEHLQNTFRRVLNVIMESGNSGAKIHENDSRDEASNNRDDIETLVEFIQKDTLKTMQLLGFNFKDAIGKPATELLASKIRSLI